MNTKNFTQIQSMLRQDLDTSRQLLALLERETQSTKTRDYQQLAQLLNEKTPLLEQLNQHAQIRSQWLSSLQQTATEENWCSLLNSFGQQELRNQWLDIKETINRCHQINELNGKLIHRGLKSHQRLLEIMKGNFQKNNVYTAKGNQQGTGVSQRVTVA